MDFLETQYKDKIREIPLSELNKAPKKKRPRNTGSTQPVWVMMANWYAEINWKKIRYEDIVNKPIRYAWFSSLGWF